MADDVAAKGYTEFKTIAIKAAADKDFFEALRVDPERALEKAGFALSQADLMRLKNALKGPATVMVDFVKLFQSMHSNIEEDLSAVVKCCIGW